MAPPGQLHIPIDPEEDDENGGNGDGQEKP
jgi:hypothetical protein